MKITDLTVSSEYGLDKLVLRWNLFPVQEPTEGCTYRVLRAPDLEGPYRPVSDVLALNRIFVDYDVNLRKQHTRYVYVIEYTSPEDGTVRTDPVVFRCADADYIAAEIIRQHKEYLRLAKARTCRFYLVKTDGMRCQCYDKITKRVTKARCPICLGTGFVGGYDGPYELPVSFGLTRMQQKLYTFEGGDSSGGEQPQNCWTLNFPRLSSGDVMVVTPTNERYKIVNTQCSMRGGTVLHQVFTAVRVNLNGVEYDIGKQP